MSDAYVGEIRIFSGNYAPQNWHICDGTLLAITDYQLLFAVLGTMYGGNGTTNFGLPDLRSRIPIGLGQGTGLTNRVQGQTGGTETVPLVAANLPSHTHAMMASPSNATAQFPGPTVILAAAVNTAGGTNKDVRYVPSTTAVGNKLAMSATSIQASGGTAAHPNIMPTRVLNYIIALNGLYPSSN